jgi:hypothetical protein
MTISELVVILQNRLLSLNEARRVAVNSGDPEKITQIDADIISTEQTLDALKNMGKILLNSQ